MKNSIFIYAPYVGSFYDKYINKLVKELDYKKIIIGSPYDFVPVKMSNIEFKKFDNLSYWNTSKDYNEIDSLLKYLDNKGIYRLHFIRYPFENFNSIINFNPLVKKFKISIGVFGFREMIETKTRINLFKNIINNDSIHSLLVHSISRDHVPKELLAFKEYPKVKFLSDPIYDDIEMYNFGISNDKRIKLLYFGTFFFSKGVDILIEAWNKTESNNIDLMIAGNSKTANFELPNLDENSNLHIIDRYLQEEEVVELMSKSNIIVLPYRSTYEFGTSGVFVQAALSKRLLIAPDIYPFNQVINKFSLGMTFESESAESMAKTIDYMAKNYKKLYKNARFNDFINDITNWKEIASLI